jgi:hypothetical protein
VSLPGIGGVGGYLPLPFENCGNFLRLYLLALYRSTIARTSRLGFGRPATAGTCRRGWAWWGVSADPDRHLTHDSAPVVRAGQSRSRWAGRCSMRTMLTSSRVTRFL